MNDIEKANKIVEILENAQKLEDRDKRDLIMKVCYMLDGEYLPSEKDADELIDKLQQTFELPDENTNIIKQAYKEVLQTMLS